MIWIVITLTFTLVNINIVLLDFYLKQNIVQRYVLVQFLKDVDFLFKLKLRKVPLKR